MRVGTAIGVGAGLVTGAGDLSGVAGQDPGGARTAVRSTGSLPERPGLLLRSFADARHRLFRSVDPVHPERQRHLRAGLVRLHGLREPATLRRCVPTRGDPALDADVPLHLHDTRTATALPTGTSSATATGTATPTVPPCSLEQLPGCESTCPSDLGCCFSGSPTPQIAGQQCYNSNQSWVTVAAPWLTFLKDACPSAYVFPNDDATTSFSCDTQPNYAVAYCPELAAP